MSVFKRKPKVIKGHTFSEYLLRYGQQYISGRGSIYKDANKLKQNHRYWEINGEYYEINLNYELRISFIVISSICILATIILPIYFCVIAPKERYKNYDFRYWNNASSLNTLKKYVADTVNPSSPNYIPKTDRIATFDMDGTLFGERSPIYIEWMFYNDYFDFVASVDSSDKRINNPVEIPYNNNPHILIPVTPLRVYQEIQKFKESQVLEDFVVENYEAYPMKLEVAEAYLGAQLFSTIPIDSYQKLVDIYLDNQASKFNNLLYKDMFYKPMIEVVEFLQLNNFNVYIVSGTDRYMVRTIVNKHMNIPYYNVIGMDVDLELSPITGEIVRTDKLLIKNVEEAKVKLIMKEIGKKPVLSFGNSSGDVDMHNFTLSNITYLRQAYMVLADDNVREIGYDEQTIQKRKADWINHNYNVISMKDDFKTIYGDGVTLKK